MPETDNASVLRFEKVGVVFDDGTRALSNELAHRGAQVTLIGTGSDADIAWPAVGNLSECLLATVRGQQLAFGVASALGVDPDRPAGLHKITHTR